MAGMNVPVKVVLKSTTTISLSDRFTEMAQRGPVIQQSTKKAPKRPPPREDAPLGRASAKNRKLAERMSRASMEEDDDIVEVKPNRSNSKSPRGRGRSKSAPTPKKAAVSVKDRIDKSKIQSDVKDRLGVVSPKQRPSGSLQSRIGNTPTSPRRFARGRGGGFNSGYSRGRGGSFTRGSRGGGMARGGFTRGGFRGGRGGTRGGSSAGLSARGRGGRGGRGRGTQQTPAKTQDQLDAEMDEYMNSK